MHVFSILPSRPRLSKRVREGFRQKPSEDARSSEGNCFSSTLLNDGMKWKMQSVYLCEEVFTLCILASVFRFLLAIKRL